jgi:hypothetical protein
MQAGCVVYYMRGKKGIYIKLGRVLEEVRGV